jgi:hypothetical protein
MTFGMDEDYHVKTFYDGSAWSGMSKFMSSVEDPDGITKVTFLADKGPYSVMSTQHYSIWISGTARPLSSKKDFFSWNLKVLSKVPFELVFSGFQNTNGFKTNEDGMVFDCQIGETNLVFTNQLVLVYDRETNAWHK